MKQIIYTLFIMLTVAACAFGQQTITGIALDGDGGEPLIGATVIIDGTTIGTVTDYTGAFEVENSTGKDVKILVSYVGYETMEFNVPYAAGKHNLGDVTVSSGGIGLTQINIIADLAIDRRTPVAVSKISAAEIEAKLGNQEFPEILKSTPSIYATKGSGGFGDSRINVRGFSQENTALLINGIPVNGMEDNKVYWSNWSGIGDVTRTIQVQRGLGASKLAVASVGGTINIITKATDQEKGGSIFASVGNDGYRKMGLTLSTGRTDDGWAFTVSGTRTTGNGYIEGNYIDAWSYFVSVAKEIGDDHLIQLIAVGAPQRHGQRSFEHDIDKQEDLYGPRWNDDFGYYRGEDFHWRENFYHKPQIGLNHTWAIGSKTTLSNAAYFSVGRGGGTGDIGGTNFREREFRQNRDDQGHVNFDELSAYNSSFNDDFPVESEFNGNIGYIARESEVVAGSDFDRDGELDDNVTRYSRGGIIKRASMNEHEWYGLLSTLSHELSSDLTLSGGVDLRWYKGIHYRKVVDLLGLDYWFDQDNVNFRGEEITVTQTDGSTNVLNGHHVRPTNEAERLWGGVDDDEKIDYHNTENINWYGAFGQLEYSNGVISAFVSAAINQTQMRRTDFFAKTPAEGQRTDWLNFTGGNVKLGANYNLNSNHNVFVNAGYISRAPYFDALFPTFDNDNPNEDAENEGITAFEIGYGLRTRNLKLNLNGYYTKWTDKTEVDDFQDEISGETFFSNLLGVDAQHMGIEMDAELELTSALTIRTFGSIGDWEWQNNPSAVVTNENQEEIGTFDLYLDGLKVGDAAQTTFGLGGDLKIGNNIKIDATFTHYDKLYAAYQPTDRDDEADLATQPFEVPSFQLVDAGISWKFDLGGRDTKLRININNLFDEEYVSDAIDRVRDGETEAERLRNSRGWFGYGRTWNASLKFNF